MPHVAQAEHRCQRCGASCAGLRARIHPDERDGILERATLLGVDRPLRGVHLRQNWGRCVFYDDGCRLHATFGIQAKPRTCRTFPVLGPDVDPACFHPGPPTRTLTVDWDDLADGRRVRAWAERLPLVAIVDGPVLGPGVAEVLAGLESHAPIPVPPAWRADLASRFAVLLHHGLLPGDDVQIALHGGAQLLAAADRLPGFAAWVRLLKLGVW